MNRLNEQIRQKIMKQKMVGNYFAAIVTYEELEEWAKKADDLIEDCYTNGTIITEEISEKLNEIFDKYSGKEHYGYAEAKKDLLDLFSFNGSLPFHVAILDGLKIDVEVKNGYLIIKNSK